MKLGVGQRALAIAAFGLFATASATPAAADTASELRELKARLQQLEAQVAKQRVEVKRATNVANAAQAHVSKDGHGHPPPPPVFVSFKNGLFVETEDKAFSFYVGGRVHADGGWQSDPANGDASNVLLRRARLDIAGKAFKHWYYRTQFEFGGSSGSVELSQCPRRLAGLQLSDPGQARPPLRKEHRHSARQSVAAPGSRGDEHLELRHHLHRAFDDVGRVQHAKATSRRVDLHGDHNWGVKTGIYSTSPQDTANRPFNNKLGQYWEVDGRAVFLPIRTEEDLIHIGATGRYYQNNGATSASNDELLVGRGVRNEANALNTRLLGTPDMSCNPGGPFNLFGSAWAANQGLGGSLVQNNCLRSAAGFNAEFVAVHGPFSIQAEYAQTSYTRELLHVGCSADYAPPP